MESYSGGAAGSAEAYGPPDQRVRRPRHSYGRNNEDYGFHRYDRWRERRHDRSDWDDRNESMPSESYRERPYGNEEHTERLTPRRSYLAARRFAPHYSINAGRANDPWHGYDAYCPDGEASD